MMRRQDQQSRIFYELSALVLNILRSPPTPIQFSDEPQPRPPVTSSSRRPPPPPPALPQITPAGFASLLLGISLALMLCGSVTFFIGFLLMPWVLGLVMIFYVVGIVSSLSMLGRAILLSYYVSIIADQRRACLETLVKVQRRDGLIFQR